MASNGHNRYATEKPDWEQRSQSGFFLSFNVVSLGGRQSSYRL